MFYIEQLIVIVRWLAITVLAIDILLVLYIFGRRLERSAYFKYKDAITRQFSGTIRSFLAGEVRSEELVAVLRTKRKLPERHAIRELLLAGINANNRSAVSDVLFHLGYVGTWVKHAFGGSRERQMRQHIVDGKPLPPAPKRGFAAIRRLRVFAGKRALAVSYLGQLDPRFAEVFMREALNDPSPQVLQANVAAMGQNQNSSAVPALLDLLQQAVQGSSTEVPVRSIKTALVRYPIGELQQFVPFLSGSSQRYRFLVVDSIREICNAQESELTSKDFPESLYRWFLDKASHDESVDARARSAGVISHFHNSDAANALRVLMKDDSEFVRLHAVRACADPYYSELMGDIVQRIGDPKWRVREAAVAALGTFGTAGRQQLANYFLTTADQYASEQVAEEMQRTGVINEMLPALAGGNDAEAWVVRELCSKMVRMGMTSLLTERLVKETNERIRTVLLDALAASPTPQLLAAVQSIARNSGDPLMYEAQALLQTNLAKPAKAGAEKN